VCLCVPILLLTLTVSSCQAPDPSRPDLESRWDAAVIAPEGFFEVDTSVGVSGVVCTASARTPFSQRRGNTHDTRSAACGDSRALGSVDLVETSLPEGGTRRVWTTFVLGSSGEAGQRAGGYALFTDTFTVGSAGNPVPLVIRVYATGTIAGNAGSSSVFYEVFTRLFRLLPDGTVFEISLPHRFPSFRDIREEADGTKDQMVEIPVPGLFPPGSRFLLVNAGSVAHALSSPSSASVRAEVSLCSPGATVRSLLTGATGDCRTSGDLKIVSVDAVQSVFGAPLIAGKDTVIAVDVKSTFAEAVEARLDVTIDTPLGPQTVSNLVTVPAGCAGPKRFYLPHPRTAAIACDPAETASGMAAEGLAPVTGQDYRVTVAIAPQEADEDPSNDSLPPASFPVKTTGLKVGYARVRCFGCSPSSIPDPQYSTAIAESNASTLAMYPLSPDGYIGERCLLSGVAGANCPIFGDLTVQTGMLIDQDRAHATVNRELPLTERVIAFVPAGYFPYHGRSANTGGLTVPGYGDDTTSLVSAPKAASAIPVVPHEMAHQIFPVGWNGGFDHYGFPSGAPPALRPLGYFVGCCEILPDAQNLMEASLSTQPPHIWIDQSTYAAILPSVLILPDPAILLITGRETRDGKIRVFTMDDMPFGVPSKPRPGDHFIDLLDDQGGVLSTTSVTAPFKMITDDGTFDLEEQPITIKLVYPPETARIRWRIMDRVLHEMDPVPQTLRTAIEQLPDRAFVKNPSQRRTALLAKVDAFGTMLEKKAFQGALQKLRNDLRPRIEEWTVDYVRDDGGQIERSALLSLLDRVEGRVEARESVP